MLLHMCPSSHGVPFRVSAGDEPTNKRLTASMAPSSARAMSSPASMPACRRRCARCSLRRAMRCAASTVRGGPRTCPARRAGALASSAWVKDVASSATSSSSNTPSPALPLLNAAARGCARARELASGSLLYMSSSSGARWCCIPCACSWPS